MLACLHTITKDQFASVHDDDVKTLHF